MIRVQMRPKHTHWPIGTNEMENEWTCTKFYAARTVAGSLQQQWTADTTENYVLSIIWDARLAVLVCEVFSVFFFMYEFFFSWCAYFFEQFFCRLLLSPRQVFFLSAVLSFLLLAASVSRFLAPKSTTNTMERSEYAHNVIIETQARVRCSMVNEGDKRMWQIYSFRCGGKTYITKHVCCVCACGRRHAKTLPVAGKVRGRRTVRWYARYAGDEWIADGNVTVTTQIHARTLFTREPWYSDNKNHMIL